MTSAKNFALIGAAGYVAPRHFRAIQDTGNQCIAALDKSDSVGIIDSYFPDAAFFTEFERFDRHLDKIRRNHTSLDYLSVCTPNYLHDAHIRFGLRHGTDVICEKPLVLNPWNVKALMEAEKESGKYIYTILQLRLHPTIIALKKQVAQASSSEHFEVDLTYITSRGKWYYASWKADESKAGGISTNIGIHFFDMLQWVFGEVKENIVHLHTHDRAAGRLELDKATVKWFLSINKATLPAQIQKRTFRSIKINEEELEFSAGFTDLHTLSYAKILSGDGFSLADASPSIQIAYDVRRTTPIGLIDDFHDFARKPLASHPFIRN
ncbi:MAG: Gfo/Idh/MocA family oxidoreductase [Saprospiraceae bacterium]